MIVMKRLQPIACLLLLSTLFSCSGNKTGSDGSDKTDTTSKYKKTGLFEVIDPSFLNLVDTAAGIEILAEGFEWSEGPVWVANGNYVLFTDIPPNKIMKWSEANGLEQYLTPAGYTGTVPRGGESGANGLMLDADGKLVLCQHGDRRLARMEAPLDSPKPVFTTLADNFEGKRLNSPNDGVFHKNGDLFFTDPPYGLVNNINDSSKEISFQGVYRVGKDGKTSLVTKNMTRPNGIAFSPDYKKLYVANSGDTIKIWNVFDVSEDGTPSNEKLFYDASSSTDPGAPDGLKIDSKGNLYATGPGGVWVFTPDAKMLGKIKVGQLCSNVALNSDQTALYITADPWLVRVKLKK
jgi:gluconolactonase